MDWYVVIKTINGHRYFYMQKTHRVGARVRTINKYLGPAGEGAAGAPTQLPLPLTTTAPTPVTNRTQRPGFDRRKTDDALELLMGTKAADWRHHWNAVRAGPVLVRRDKRIERIFKKLGVRWSHTTTGCFYAPARDIVNIPPLRCFDAVDGQSATAAYYVVVLHEIVHWTQRRVERKADLFGTEYAREELVAELGAVMLMEHFGLEIGCPERHALYFQTWLGRAGDRKCALAHARKEAERAVQWILDHEN